RPLTHDLFVAVMGETGITLDAVHVTDLRDGTFFAELHLSQGEHSWVVSSRPSDAIALASRLDEVPIYGAENVLDEAGLEIDPDAEGDPNVDPDEELRQFRRFLESVTPEDFKD
ncbi:MAG TPA: bifunctional nuclease family protein, partial [Nitriliruptorales bacterium]